MDFGRLEPVSSLLLFLILAEQAAKQASAAPVQAIHLAEVALAAEPAHAGALRASLAAHEQLLARSTNFWETAWLKREITRLRQALDVG